MICAFELHGGRAVLVREINLLSPHFITQFSLRVAEELKLFYKPARAHVKSNYKYYHLFRFSSVQ